MENKNESKSKNKTKKKKNNTKQNGIKQNKTKQNSERNIGTRASLRGANGRLRRSTSPGPNWHACNGTGARRRIPCGTATGFPHTSAGRRADPTPAADGPRDRMIRAAMAEGSSRAEKRIAAGSSRSGREALRRGRDDRGSAAPFRRGDRTDRGGPRDARGSREPRPSRAAQRTRMRRGDRRASVRSDGRSIRCHRSGDRRGSTRPRAPAAGSAPSGCDRPPWSPRRIVRSEAARARPDGGCRAAIECRLRRSDIRTRDRARRTPSATATATRLPRRRTPGAPRGGRRARGTGVVAVVRTGAPTISTTVASGEPEARTPREGVQRTGAPTPTRMAARGSCRGGPVGRPPRRRRSARIRRMPGACRRRARQPCRIGRRARRSMRGATARARRTGETGRRAAGGPSAALRGG